MRCCLFNAIIKFLFPSYATGDVYEVTESDCLTRVTINYVGDCYIGYTKQIYKDNKVIYELDNICEKAFFKNLIHGKDKVSSAFFKNLIHGKDKVSSKELK